MNVKIIFLDIGIVIENSIPIELHHVQDTLNFTSNEGTLDLPSDFLTEIFFIVLFLDPTPEIDSTWRIIFHQSDLENHDHYTENFPNSKV